MSRSRSYSSASTKRDRASRASPGPESVDQALCFGWIDGVRRSLGDDSYTIRFTPRKTKSTWSAINIKRVQRVDRPGLMHPAGLRAFAARTADNSAIYSYERPHVATLEPEEEAQFRANEAAWAFFQTQPPSYRRTALHWVVSPKRAETRQKRLATLIDDSANGRTIRLLTRPSGAK